VIWRMSSAISHGAFSAHRRDPSRMSLSTGHVRRSHWTTDAVNGIVSSAMSEIRALRRAAGLKQREFAALLSVPPETLRTWDSGRRRVPLVLLRRARDVGARHRRQEELLPLGELARELGVHVRTLRAAARTERLRAHFSVRSVFGRRCVAPRALPVSSSSHGTTGASVGRRYAWLRCRPCPTTMTSGYERCAGGAA
jgi:DNA-binding transcriptional regulator YiaG